MNKEIKALIEEGGFTWKESLYFEKEDNSYTPSEIAELAFIDGIRKTLSLFRWRKVSEELPPLDVYVLTKRKRKCDNKEYPALNKMYFEPKADKVIWEMELPDTSTTTHWIPIPEGGNDE